MTDRVQAEHRTTPGRRPLRRIIIAAAVTLSAVGVGGTSAVAEPAPTDDAVANAVVDLGSLGEFTPITPARFLDTRTGTGAPVGKLGADSSIDIPIAGRLGVPVDGVAAIVVNVTAVTPTAQSFVAVYPTGIERPDIANLNVIPGQNRANLVTVRLGDSGELTVYNRFGTMDVVFDVAGYYATADGPSGSRFRPLTPVRIADTRDGTGGVPVGRIGSEESIVLNITGRAGVPAAGVVAVAFNLTIVGPTTNSFAVAYPEDVARPEAANVNVQPGKNTGNQVIVRVPASGAIRLFNRLGSVDFVVDLVGYYDAPDESDNGRFLPVDPFRFLDTRQSSPLPGDGSLGPGDLLFSSETQEEFLAVAMNVTAAQPIGNGNIRAFPHPGTQPNASTVNYVDGQTIPNHAMVPGGPAIGWQNNVGRTHLVVDVFGFFCPESCDSVVQ